MRLHKHISSGRMNLSKTPQPLGPELEFELCSIHCLDTYSWDGTMMSGVWFKIMQGMGVARKWNKTDHVLVILEAAGWIGIGFLQRSLCFCIYCKFSMRKSLIQKMKGPATLLFYFCSFLSCCNLPDCRSKSPPHDTLSNFYFPYRLSSPFLWLMHSRQKLLFFPEHFYM